VRDARWKLRVNTLAAGETAVELYDLLLDPSERWDVAADHADIVQRLSGRMRAFSRETGATLSESVLR
jgi:hypothetical protein